MKKFYFLILFVIGKLYAQLPETELFLAEIEINSHLLKVKQIQKISNHKGYNNQPAFINKDNTILFSTDIESDGKTHICSYDLKSKKIQRLSITNTSEYSAALLPDQKDYSVVMVEKDSTQRIWVFDLNKGDNKSCLSQQTDSVGYYTWLGKDSILYYKLTQPHSLHALNLVSNQDVWLCNQPCRSFKKINDHAFFYVIHEANQNSLYIYDVRTKKASLSAIDPVIKNEDYSWHPTFGFLKSEGNKIYRYSDDTKVWVEIADFSSHGITKISRFTLSQNGKFLCLVAHPNP